MTSNAEQDDDFKKELDDEIVSIARDVNEFREEFEALLNRARKKYSNFAKIPGIAMLYTTLAVMFEMDPQRIDQLHTMAFKLSSQIQGQ